MSSRVDLHARTRELLAARLDRPLARAEWRILNGHLRKCASCQQIDVDYRAQRFALRALPPTFPPRDLWARTSAALDREVRHSYRIRRWWRRAAVARRSAQRSTSLLTIVAALGVVAAVGVIQLAPSFQSSAGTPGRPTPFAVIPQPLSFVGLGPTDIALYRTSVSQVCPDSEPLDCIETERISRTPMLLPGSMHAGNIALSPSGQQLAVVGRYLSADVISVVTMPTDGDQPIIEPNTDGGTLSPVTPTPAATVTPTTSAQPSPTVSQPATEAPDESASPAPASATVSPAPTAPPNNSSPDPSAVPSTLAPSPPPSAVPGLAVLNILDQVQSAGSPPAWSDNGGTLAFSAMPIDGSHGPDVYVWSPTDTKARAITDDHASFFASWSANRIVLSRLIGDDPAARRPKTFVIDPQTLEERAVGGPRVWLPTVNQHGTQAVAWYGELDTSELLPQAGTGALYLLDWTAVDPFGTQAGPSVAPDDTASPDAADEPRLTALEPARNPHSAPVLDWQARWSNDGQVLGIWIADSVGSTWGRLAVLAVDPATLRITSNQPLLGATLARRGFSLGMSRVAWVGPSDANVDGELRIRTWGNDGFGGLRVSAPDQEEVLPAF